MSRVLAIRLLAISVGANGPTWALEFTADRITNIDGRTGKDASYSLMFHSMRRSIWSEN
jgi:hypothetical protein